MTINTAPMETDDISDLLRSAMKRELAIQGTTKRNALRIALVMAINSGVLAPGTRLPAESALCRFLGVSLGTVQAALGQVQDLGLLERRRGDGTRVLECPGFNPVIWHFRMYNLETGAPFRILDQDIELLTTNTSGPWTGHLGDVGDYTVIRRRITGSDHNVIGAEMVLDRALLPPEKLKATELRLANLRTVIEDILNVKAARGVQRLRLHEMSARDRAIFSLPTEGPILRLEARTTTTLGQPLYHQMIYIPADALEVEL